MKPVDTAPRVMVVRVYDESPESGAHRVLVDRLWPRGVTKDAAALDEWSADVAPTTELRRWYGHDPAKFAEFARRYRAELVRPPASNAVSRLLDIATTRRVALVTATRDVEHSGAQVLHDHLIHQRWGGAMTLRHRGTMTCAPAALASASAPQRAVAASAERSSTNPHPYEAQRPLLPAPASPSPRRRYTMELVVYGDFNCPYSCLASARADILVERGIAAVEWRAVEHDPSIPLPSEPVDGDLAVMLDREVAEVSGLLRADETFPIRRPPVHPNSAAAVAVFAASPPDGSSQLRRSLFGALWFAGRDIGDRAVLAALGAEEGHDTQRVAAWRDEWLRFDRRVVPMLVLPDGYVSRGLGALGRLADLASGPAAPRRSAADPARPA